MLVAKAEAIERHAVKTKKKCEACIISPSFPPTVLLSLPREGGQTPFDAVMLVARTDMVKRTFYCPAKP